MTFYEVIDQLEKQHGHTELWFYSGTGETEPDLIANNIANWKWPKILKRNGRAVAEYTGKGKDWEFMGDYKTPDNDPCSLRREHAVSTINSSPFAFCLITEPVCFI